MKDIICWKEKKGKFLVTLIKILRVTRWVPVLKDGYLALMSVLFTDILSEYTKFSRRFHTQMEL